MKIKCPVCNEKDFYNLGNDDRHKIRYHELLFKIHEKIESLQNRELVTADLVQNMTDDKLLQELKSLLEDKK